MIAVTGATGKLGRHVIDGLLQTVGAGEIVAIVRDPAKASEMAGRGVQVRQAEYSDPGSLVPALDGADKVLLISSSEVGRRGPQHQAVIDASKAAGVKLLAYTSILRADVSTLTLAAEHKATEEAIRAADLPFVFLRNGWYLENHTEALAPALEHGAILGAAGEGRFASAARADYAGAAVAVLTTPGHEGRAYELAGDAPYTLAELAAEVSRQAQKTVSYRNLSVEEYAAALAGFGLPAPFAAILADADGNAAKGELDSSSRDLSFLTGRPTATLADAVGAALRAAQT